MFDYLTIFYENINKPLNGERRGTKMKASNFDEDQNYFPIGGFFLHPDFHGLNIFYTVLHMTNMDNFLYFNHNKIKKLNDIVLWTNNIANNL